MTDRKETPTEFVEPKSLSSSRISGQRTPTCGSFMQRRPSETPKSQSKTKFDHIVQKLPQKIMVSVRSLIIGFAASTETPYKDLKAKFVSSYTLLRWQKVSKLIHHPGLGD